MKPRRYLRGGWVNMKNKKYYLFVVVFGALFTVGVLTIPDYDISNDQTVAGLKAISQPLVVNVADNMSKAQILMEWTYTNMKRGSSPPNYNPFIMAKHGEGECGIFSMLFIGLCTVENLTARYIGGWANESYSHATVEVLIDGRWVLFDPYYNLNQNMSALELHNNPKLIITPVKVWGLENNIGVLVPATPMDKALYIAYFNNIRVGNCGGLNITSLSTEMYNCASVKW